MPRYIEENEIYKLFNARGVAQLHVADIDVLPRADVVEVVHGQWVYDHWCEFKCSNCGHWSDSKPYKGKENYCPNCGAKMEE